MFYPHIAEMCDCLGGLRALLNGDGASSAARSQMRRALVVRKRFGLRGICPVVCTIRLFEHPANGQRLPRPTMLPVATSISHDALPRSEAWHL